MLRCFSHWYNLYFSRFVCILQDYNCVLYEQRNPLEWYFTSHGVTLHEKKFVQSICGVVYTKSAEKKIKTRFNHLKSFFIKKMNIIVSY